MANIKSNAKRVLTNKKAEIRNKAHKSQLKTELKKLKVAVEAKDKSASTILSKVYKLVDSGVTKNIWHKNNGDRKKAAAAKLVK